MRASSLLPVFGILAFGQQASAATQTASMAVSAVVHNVCTVAATPMAFGLYEPASGAASTVTGQVNLSCSLGTAYSVGLAAGVSANVAQRELTNGSDSLAYNLYQDNSYSVVWGDTAGANTVNGTYTASQQPLPVYGRISGGQSVTPGSYSDTITVTVTY